MNYQGLKSIKMDMIEFQNETIIKPWIKVKWNDLTGWIHTGEITTEADHLKRIAFEEKMIIDLANNTFGGVPVKSTEKEIIKAFGKENTLSTEEDIGEGMLEPALVVFPKTNNRLVVFWSDEKREKISEIRISHPESSWRTLEGIKIGVSVAELEQINGDSFEYTGFGWDYGGTIVSWKNGVIPSWFKVVLFSDDLEFRSTHQGEIFFDSSEEDIKVAKLHIDSFRLMVY